jgi:hypothetical protein
MRRIASVLLLVGSVLLATWALAPAAAPPAPGPATPKDLAAFDQTAPVVSQIDQEVAQLRARLKNLTSAAQPERDPFQFGASRPEPPRVKPGPPVPAPPPLDETPAAPAVVWPHLVAILSETTDGALVRRAVLALGDDVDVVRPGGLIGKYLVKSIDVDMAELTDTSTGATVRVWLR